MHEAYLASLVKGCIMIEDTTLQFNWASGHRKGKPSKLLHVSSCCSSWHKLTQVYSHFLCEKSWWKEFFKAG